MDIDNPFDRKIEAQRATMPGHFRDAAIELTDTLDLAWAAAQAVFEKKATPEHAIALLPLFMERADALRRSTERSLRSGKADAAAPGRSKRG